MCELSAREREVAELIAADKSYREIALLLNLQQGSVKTYATRIRRKLQVRSKVAVAMWVMRQKKGN